MLGIQLSGDKTPDVRGTADVPGKRTVSFTFTPLPTDLFKGWRQIRRTTWPSERRLSSRNRVRSGGIAVRTVTPTGRRRTTTSGVRRAPDSTTANQNTGISSTRKQAEPCHAKRLNYACEPSSSPIRACFVFFGERGQHTRGWLRASTQMRHQIPQRNPSDSNDEDPGRVTAIAHIQV